MTFDDLAGVGENGLGGGCGKYLSGEWYAADHPPDPLSGKTNSIKHRHDLPDERTPFHIIPKGPGLPGYPNPSMHSIYTHIMKSN